MQRIFVAGLIGLIFGAGIAMSGMANPAKVLNFFDIAGTWDPSLAFVTGGALLVTAIGYRFVLRRSTTVLTPQFHLPANRKLDVPLLAGSAVFGVAGESQDFVPVAPSRRLASASHPHGFSWGPCSLASRSPA